MGSLPHFIVALLQRRSVLHEGRSQGLLIRFWLSMVVFLFPLSVFTDDDRHKLLGGDRDLGYLPKSLSQVLLSPRQLFLDPLRLYLQVAQSVQERVSESLDLFEQMLLAFLLLL